MFKLSENEYLEIATKDIEGADLMQYLAKKFPNTHPLKLVENIEALFNDKKYQKLVASLIAVKLQRIRSNVLKQIDSLMSDNSDDLDVLKSLDKLLAIVLKFTKLDDEEHADDNRLIIRYGITHEEKFKKETSNEISQ